LIPRNEFRQPIPPRFLAPIDSLKIPALDYISESLETIILGLKYLNSLMQILDGKNSDPGSGMEKLRIQDPG
jgi:hypothetical protein